MAALMMAALLFLAGVSAAPNAVSRVIVVGGSSGMGKAAAQAVVSRGGSVLLVSRSAEKLAGAREHILHAVPTACESSVQTEVVDASDESSVVEFAARLSPGEWDGIVCSAAGPAPHGPIGELPTERTLKLFSSKFWTAYFVCKHLGPICTDGGAIVLVAGVLNRRPGLNCVPLATVNGALEGLTRSLALEFGPRLRVNCLSPGFCDTERFDNMDPQRKAAMLANTAASLPLQRVGRPLDMGNAIDFLLRAEYCTGVVLDCDGGHHIRQYANPTTDPMRK